MSKYVCGFSQVTAVGNKLIEASNTLTSAVSKYSSAIDGSLTSWSGTAKSNFSNQSTAQVNKVLDKAKQLASLGQFIVDAANNIQNLDDELSNMNI